MNNKYRLKIKGKNPKRYIGYLIKEKISLYDDVILKYELLLKKEIDNKLLEEIIKYNEKIERIHKIILI